MQFYAQNLIYDAARTIQAIGSGEPLNPDELADALVSLNKVVDNLGALGLLIMQIAEQAIVLNGQSQPYALSFRPAKIKAAQCTSGVLSDGVEILSAEQWTQIVDESRSGKFATKMFCDYAVPNSNIFWWPKATGTLHLYYYAPLTQFPDLLATQVTLAPAYARLLTLSLAVDMAEQYGKTVTQSLMAKAMEAKSDVATANNRIFGADPIPDQPMPQSPGKQTQQAA